VQILRIDFYAGLNGSYSEAEKLPSGFRRTQIWTNYQILLENRPRGVIYLCAVLTDFFNDTLIRCVYFSFLMTNDTLYIWTKYAFLVRLRVFMCVGA
jgi:hypothetical protein